MNGQELESFLLNPVTFLGDWSFDITGPTGTAGTKSTVQLVSVPEAVEIIQYVAASNNGTLYIAKDNARQTYKVTTSTPGGQAQTKPGYKLPWKEHKAYHMTLGSNAELFVTARLNGCCIMIAGDRQSPTVVHANCGSDELLNVGIDVSTVDKATASRVTKAHLSKVYGKFYWELMGRLITLGVLSDQHPVTLFDPGTYGADPLPGFARVYGIRRDDGWSFYACVETAEKKNAGTENARPVCQNKQIWP